MKTLQQCSDDIYAMCEPDEDGHLIYKGKGSDVNHIIHITFCGKSQSLAKILFANKYNILIDDVRDIRRICRKSLCLEPEHFCQKKDLHKGEKDGNGFTEIRRKNIMFMLQLLPKQYNSKDCVHFEGTKDKDGYGRITITYKSIGAHILSLQLKIGRPLLPKMQASHICNQPSCVNPFHLVEETGSQNTRRQKQYKLNHDNILEIYNLKGKLTQAKIAEKFDIVRSTVQNIHRGVTYHDITGHETPKKLNRSDFEITQSMRDILKIFLKNKCDLVLDETTGETHTIPRNLKTERDGYIYTIKFGYKISVHKLAAIVKYNLDRFPDTKKNEFVLHSCRRKDCCDYNHISIGTAQQNAIDRKRDGTHRSAAKITKELAEQIRNESTGTVIEIARKFKTTEYTVQEIRNKRSWVDDEIIVGEPSKKKQRVSRKNK